MGSTQKAIAYRHVSKAYLPARRGGPVPALEDISLEVSEGEFISVVGPSGCGKTTLLKMTCGLTLPSDGEIRIGGVPVREPVTGIGFIFQTPLLCPWRRIIDNVLLPVEMLGLRKEDYREEALRLLNLVGLEGFESRYPFELSGGMQQRVSLARCLIRDPPIMLMDEPFGSVDALTRDQLDLELLRIHRAKGKTIVFVTHSIMEATLLADRIVVLGPRPGRVRGVIEIGLPRPRGIDVMTTQEFAAYVGCIRNLVGENGQGEGRGLICPVNPPEEEARDRGANRRLGR